MDRGTRLISFFQMLEKLMPGKSARFGPDDIQQLRYVTSKILQYVSTQEKVHRDLILKNNSYLDQLLVILENANDTSTEQNIVYILNELIGKTHTGKKVSTLVNHGATHVLFHVLVSESREPDCSEELLISVHQILSKLGPKDRKFGVKARLSQALGVTLGLVRNYCSSPKLLQSVVHVLKLYAANAVNASYLGKNGAVSYLFKVLSLCGRKHLTLVKNVLDTLGQLVKSKSNSARAIGQGGVPVLLTMFYDWHKVDTKNKHLNLRKSILTVLKNLTNLKSGRKALMDADGVRILYEVCQDSLDSRELENQIFMASLIMRKCFPRNRLPLANLRSPLSYPLPQSDFHVPEMGEGQEVPLMNSITEPSQTGDENGYESSIDNDDDVSSDDDPEARKADSDEGANELTKEVPYKRNWEDLCMYREFFPETFEFDDILEDEQLYGCDRTIVIPTASSEANRVSYGQHVQGSLSADSVQSTRRGMTPNLSAPVLSRTGREDFLSSALGNLGLGPRSHVTDSVSDIFSRQQDRGQDNECPRSRTKGTRNFTDDTGSDTTSISSASAVNVKTGSSIFSLDFSPGTSKKGLVQRSPKSKRKGNKPLKGSAVKEKRTRSSKSSKTDDWFTPSNDLVMGSSSVSNTIVSSSSREQLGTDGDNSDENDSTEQDDYVLPKYEEPEIYAEIAAKTKSVGRFNKLAYPDMYGSLPPPYREALFEKRFGTQRQKIFEDIDRFINPDQALDHVVYDLDAIVKTSGPTYTGAYSNHANRDEIRVSKKEDLADHLKFNSQFECGNLRKAIQIRKYEYDLILNPDVNTNHHHQWFYFEVSNMEAGVKYRFNIVNCEKINSQFNFGMKPVMFSVAEATQGRPFWGRIGSEICYYKNHFVRSSQTTGGVRGKTYFTSTFTVSFKHEKDVCYLAYHYPYTYSMLQYHLYKWDTSYDSSQIYFKNQTLTHTISGNPVPVLTITAHPCSYDSAGLEQFKNRPYIFLSSRVHPGESNSSWVMKGTIDFLLSDKPVAQNLRDMYIFKIVPMLNPDGVLNGNHRCSLVAEDLNRRWLLPCPKLHPTIYHTKGLLQYLYTVGKAPLVYCDYHGHSRKKNVFLYGCSPAMSWMPEDMENPGYLGPKMEDTGYKTLPRVLHHMAPAFCLSNCSFMVEKSKESTARVVVWRQLGVVRSYTMESSYCGCDQGPYRGCHLCTRQLEEMGRKFCEGLVKVKSRHAKTVSNAVAVISAASALGLSLPPPQQLPPQNLTSAASKAGFNLDEEMPSCSRDALAPHVPPLNLPSHSSSSGSASDDEDDDDDDDEEEEDDDLEEAPIRAPSSRLLSSSDVRVDDPTRDFLFGEKYSSHNKLESSNFRQANEGR